MPSVALPPTSAGPHTGRSLTRQQQSAACAQQPARRRQRPASCAQPYPPPAAHPAQAAAVPGNLAHPLGARPLQRRDNAAEPTRSPTAAGLR